MLWFPTKVADAENSIKCGQVFKELVQDYHRHGIEVWSEVVYNHIVEDNKGSTYYLTAIDE
jgi:pullulanase/glycogen debranching enzyme